MFLHILLFVELSVALSAQEIAELQKIRSTVSLLNGGDITGMTAEWQTGDLSNACTFFGIFCTPNGNIDGMFTQAFFQLSGNNQIFAPSLIDYTKFFTLRDLVIENRQMTGDFNFKLPSTLRSFYLRGDLSTSSTGGYTMVGTLPTNMFLSTTLLEQLEISTFPKLSGSFPSTISLTALRLFTLGDVAISGAFPDMPSPSIRQITIVGTELGPSLPSSYCKVQTTFASDVDPNILSVAKNPKLVSLPSCVQTCAFSPINNPCAIKLNNVCDIGQNSADDDLIEPGVFGALQDFCSLGNDNPCTLSRDNDDCLDCTGNVDSGHTYDLCGVCNKPSDSSRNSCLDCLGIPFGTNQYDICGVCMGDADTCFDCFGVAGGSARLDICGVCGGHGASCDCAGVTGGTSVLDDCGVCDGDNACYDCLGVPHGTTEYDLCGVCAGSSDTCSDCSGVPAGTKVYDNCDVCGGTGADCDCAGVYLGFSVLDACDICGGDDSTCKDCMGVPNGPAVYDVCDVCNGSDMEGGCENPSDDNALVQAAERTSTFVFIVIIGVLSLICIVTAVVVVLSLRRRTAAPVAPMEPAKQQFVNDRARGGTVGFNKFTLLVVALLMTLTPVHCVLPETTQFLESIAAHTNAMSVYPEWFIGSNVRQQCSASMVDLTCVGHDIGEVHLTRSLTGFYGLAEEQFVSFLPLATKISVKNSPSLIFTLDGIGNSPLLRTLEVSSSGLTGTIPTDIENCAALTSLVISDTKVGGTLPVEVGELTLLRNLTISRSELTSIATVPFGNLNALTYLDLHANKILESLPSSIGSIENLVELHLSANGFLFIIPAEYRELANLKVLDVAENFLSLANAGLFSGAVGPLQSSLEVLLLDHNGFGPELPNLTGYSKLVHIGLSHNSFSRDFSGLDGFYYGETGAIALVVLANHNRFTALNSFVNQPFYGECNFTFNRLCTDTVAIASQYFTLQCDLGLRPHDCAPAPCGDTSCHDCLGRPNGPSTYDACDVCGGSGTTCLDCNGVPNGPSTYDACHVCGGDGSSCVDCSGVPNGDDVYDACDVCDGDDSSCADCAGVPLGASTYDACDVCNGRGRTCLDCMGVLNGTSKFDECGVCNGDGLSCADPLIADYLTNRGSFTAFVLLAILLMVLVVIAGVLIYLNFSL